jgi:hypothetical protein
VKGLPLTLGAATIFLNDLVTDSPHLGRARLAPTQSTKHGGRQPTRKRPNDDPMVEASKRWQRGKGLNLVEVVLSEMDVEAVVELIQTMAKFTSTPSQEL